jgi:hypothetical protein
MPVLLAIIGFLALVAGLVMIGFGIPINEFSFGNTLISAGTTASVGGLVIISIAVVVGQLRRVAEALNAQAPGRLAQPMEAVEQSPIPRMIPPQGRVPFPLRPKAEAYPAEPSVITAPPLGAAEERLAQTMAPTLPNPDETAPTVPDEVPISLQRAQGGKAPAESAQGMAEDQEPSAPSWRSAPPPPLRPLAPNFDAMWPVDTRPAKGHASEANAEPKVDMPSREGAAPAPQGAEVEAQKPRAVAILKSGVVDGMGYTLYVDGSIEAELPQGTLRFASINELRSHLEKNS